MIKIILGSIAITLFIVSPLLYSIFYDDSTLQYWRDLEKQGKANRIKFKTFELMYDMNSSHWDLKSQRYEKYTCEYKPVAGEYFTFTFGFIDYFKYKHFCKTLESGKKEKFKIQEAKKYLEYFKRDIANYEEENKKRTEQILKDIWKDKELLVAEE